MDDTFEVRQGVLASEEGSGGGERPARAPSDGGAKIAIAEVPKVLASEAFNQLILYLDKAFREGKINEIQNNYIVSNCLDGSHLEETLKEFALVDDFKQFIENIQRQQAEIEQQKQEARASVFTQISDIEPKIKEMQSELTRLEEEIDKPHKDYLNTRKRYEEFPDNINLRKRVEIQHAELQPKLERINELRTEIMKLQHELSSLEEKLLSYN